MNQEPEGWEARLTAVVADQVRYWRTRRGWSAQDVADRCEALGYRVPRSTLTNLENKRRGTITLAELLTVAEALGVPPILLICPFGQVEEVELLPGQNAPVDLAAMWVSGRFEADGRPPAQPEPAGYVASTGVIPLTPRVLGTMMHAHAAAVVELSNPAKWSGMYADNPEAAAQQISQHARTIRFVEDALRREGMVVPLLPEDVARDVAALPGGETDAP